MTLSAVDVTVFRNAQGDTYLCLFKLLRDCSKDGIEGTLAIANTVRPIISVAININSGCGGNNGRDEITSSGESHARSKQIN